MKGLGKEGVRMRTKKQIEDKIDLFIQIAEEMNDYKSLAFIETLKWVIDDNCCNNCIRLCERDNNNFCTFNGCNINEPETYLCDFHQSLSEKKEV